MDSIIFRRSTRKGCGCMRGGGMMNTLTSQIQNAVQSLTGKTNKVEESVTTVHNAVQSPSGNASQMIHAANTAVVAANAAVNQSKQLAALANRVNALARKMNSMNRPMMGGKRNRRTRRK